MTSSAPKSEILRVVYWLYGEGLGDVVDIALTRALPPVHHQAGKATA